ncbi:putative rna binding effector protein scp160 protein [Eutypa lata UCREL1]|uniref:Putative rna binding effector protein scp160 protein n=1 Tax=Eutypa lata (strain UCR-EL1) TaxID=1287681 RepID=M7SJA2_EUTLA|nr:putative rna binding effector protein scp160 protein [Eutypa lata UCREL1]
MASESVNNASEGSLAQKLMEQHAQHPLNPTVEDVPDEEGSNAPPSADATGTSSWEKNISAKAAGKQKAQAATLDTESQEAFPALGSAEWNLLVYQWNPTNFDSQLRRLYSYWSPGTAFSSWPQC